jgi:hypothetical protein
MGKGFFLRFLQSYVCLTVRLLVSVFERTCTIGRITVARDIQLLRGN